MNCGATSLTAGIHLAIQFNIYTIKYRTQPLILEYICAHVASILNTLFICTYLHHLLVTYKIHYSLLHIHHLHVTCYIQNTRCSVSIKNELNTFTIQNTFNIIKYTRLQSIAY